MAKLLPLTGLAITHARYSGQNEYGVSGSGCYKSLHEPDGTGITGEEGEGGAKFRNNMVDRRKEC